MYFTPCTLSVIFIISLVLPSPLVGETIYWNGGNGYFNDASMWTPSQVPGPNDEAFIVAKGVYNVILDSQDTTSLLNLTIGGLQECTCDDEELCTIILFIQSSLQVTNNINVLLFGVVAVVDTEVTASLFLSQQGSLSGSGTITAKSVFESSFVTPGHLEPLGDPSAQYVFLSDIGQLQFNGNLSFYKSTFDMSIGGNETNLETDKVIVNGFIDGGIDGVQVNRVWLEFLPPNDVDQSYDKEFNVLYADNITIGEWAVEGFQVEEGDEMILPAQCLVPVQVPACPMSGFAIILRVDTGTCCPATGCVVLDCPGEPDCNYHGQCMENPDPSGLPQCLCYDGWTGNACDIPDCSSAGSCNYRGTCSNGQCQCETNWTGIGCTDPICSATCSEHGYCRSIDAIVYCDCFDGYEGPNCDQLIPEGECSDDCNGRGTCECNIYGCACHCNATFQGRSCNIPQCNTSCHHGQCVSDGKVAACQCDSGWKGNNCTIQTCPSECSGNGECVSFGGAPQCNCVAPFTGSDCSLTEQISNGSEKESSKTMPIAVGVSLGVAAILIVGAIIGGVVILNRRKAQRKKARDIQLQNVSY